MNTTYSNSVMWLHVAGDTAHRQSIHLMKTIHWLFPAVLLFSQVKRLGFAIWRLETCFTRKKFPVVDPLTFNVITTSESCDCVCCMRSTEILPWWVKPNATSGRTSYSVHDQLFLKLPGDR